LEKIFDAAAWMRKRRTEIDEEDKGLSWEEKREKTRRLPEKDPLWPRLRGRFIEPTNFSVKSIQADQADSAE
jgi:hypothetical protein